MLACNTRALRITRRQAGAAAALGLAGPSASRGGGAVAAAAGLPHPQGRPATHAALRAARRAEAAEEPRGRRRRRFVGSQAERSGGLRAGGGPGLEARVRGQAARRRRPRRDAARESSARGGELALRLGLVDFLQPIADLQQRTRCDLVPLGVQAEVMGAVQRSGGIAALSEQQRNAYVDDVGAFVRYPKQTAAFDVWAERVVARTYKKRYEGLEGAPKYEDYFASSILYDEAVASLAARYCRAHPSTLLVCVVSDDHVKFGCSAQGRFQRLEKNPDGLPPSSSARRPFC